MPETITPRPTRRAPVTHPHDMAFAIEFTGRTRQTLMKALALGEIPEAIQAKPNAPWYFTKRGLRRYIGIRDDESGAA